MNADLIDSVFASESSEEYFYAVLQGDDVYYGGHFENDALFEMLIALYENEPTSKPDLIKFAHSILHSTNS
jgi:hypothetical protein